MWTQIRYSVLWRSIRVYSVCYSSNSILERQQLVERTFSSVKTRIVRRQGVLIFEVSTVYRIYFILTEHGIFPIEMVGGICFGNNGDPCRRDKHAVCRRLFGAPFGRCYCSHGSDYNTYYGMCFPGNYPANTQRGYNVAATSRRCSDVVTTLRKRIIWHVRRLK